MIAIDSTCPRVYFGSVHIVAFSDFPVWRKYVFVNLIPVLCLFPFVALPFAAPSIGELLNHNRDQYAGRVVGAFRSHQMENLNHNGGIHHANQSHRSDDRFLA